MWEIHCYIGNKPYQGIKPKTFDECFVEFLLFSSVIKLAAKTRSFLMTFGYFDSSLKWSVLFNSAYYFHKYSSQFHSNICEHLLASKNDYLDLVLTASKHFLRCGQTDKKSKLELLCSDYKLREIEGKAMCLEKDNYNTQNIKKEDDDFGQKGCQKGDLMNELLSSKNFRINPQVITVYIVDGVPRHPARLGAIQWSWLNEEKWRLHTFSRYPHNAPKSAILLAADGFAYMGTGRDLDDSVICFFCILMRKNWQPLDDISEVHQQLKPCCSMVTKIDCTNVPMETTRDSSFFDAVYKEMNKSHNNSTNDNDSHDIEHDGEVSVSSVTGAIRDTVNSTVSKQFASNNVPQPTATASSPIPGTIASSSAQNSHVTNAPAVSVSSQSMVTVTSSSTLASDSVTQGPPARTATDVVSSANPGPVSSLPASFAAQPPSNLRASASNAQTVPNPNQVSSAAASNTTPQTTVNSSQNTVKSNAGGPTYSELGIVTERPKRFEYALLAKRMETFLSWPRDHNLRPKELAEAGFYYAGYGDCARCFYCGGGLRNWEDEDDVWVEHARWFPKCAYIRQQMGQVFVDTVQELNKIKDHIPFTMVMDEIGHAASAFQLDSKDNPLKRDPAVKTIVDMGYPLAEVIAVAEAIKEDGSMLSADKIYDKLVVGNIKKNPNCVRISEIETDGGEREAAHGTKLEMLRKLKEKNNQLRQQTVCKICMDKDVAVVFLPCGHFVSCTDCASAMKDCPVCRNHVKGIVRAFMG